MITALGSQPPMSPQEALTLILSIGPAAAALALQIEARWLRSREGGLAAAMALATWAIDREDRTPRQRTPARTDQAES